MIINGDRDHLAMTLRKLNDIYSQSAPDIEDSLDAE